MSKTIKTKITLRNDIAANWTKNNPVLLKGQMGIESDTKKFKFGDGITNWNNLDYGAGADIPLASATANGLLSKEDFNKIQSIEDGAEANVQSDWTALQGDAAILNKPTTLAGYGITDAMTITEIETAINNAIASAFTYKGVKATVTNLPTTGNTVGDVWHVNANSGQYVWNGSSWDELGSLVDLSGYLQKVEIAGIELIPNSYTITVAQLKTALGLGDAAYKNVDTSIQLNSSSENVPTSAAVSQFLSQNGTKVEASETNGNILVDGVETKVYELPDVLLFDCGNSTNNYS